MKVRELMTQRVIKVHAKELVSVAARTLAHYNVGAVPVCDEEDRLCGILTDRDIVTRCLAANQIADKTMVGEIMTSQVYAVQPDTEVSAAANTMGVHQIRRLPVVEQGKLCGMVSLGDLANHEESVYDATNILGGIMGNISCR
jgi:CBS domain-containing protein